MAQVYRFRPPPRRPRSKLTPDRLALAAFVAGVIGAWGSLYVPGLDGLAILVGLGVAFGVYMALFDRAR